MLIYIIQLVADASRNSISTLFANSYMYVYSLYQYSYLSTLGVLLALRLAEEVKQGYYHLLAQVVRYGGLCSVSSSQ